ncbi:MAG: ABC transporter permease [Oscillospiraceae bacterium]|jgi:putative ABC transport system permease protein|nr:ABC transporter permease [Oscillospiraceae bacterium]
MNIFNKVTWQSLKRSRTRTAVTIIGVILSVAMLAAVTTFIASLQNFLLQGQIAEYGDWHVKFTDTDSAFVQEAAAASEVKNSAAVQNIGYSLLEGGQNPNKPYIFVAGLDDSAFDMLPVRLIEGRLPQNSGEIVIPEHLELNGGVSLKIGQTLVLPVGIRTLDGHTLGQKNSYQGSSEHIAAETFTPLVTKTYTIVGIIERPGFEGYSAPGYTAVTMPDAQAAGNTAEFDVFVALKKPGTVYGYAEKAAGQYGTEFNSGLLRIIGVSDNDNFNAILYSLGGILIAMIMIGGILLIYNSFAISVSERSRQFGILSSVGATKKQLQRSVLFEGICIGAIGIPVGILAGIGGIGVTLRFIGGIFRSLSATETTLSLTVSIPAIIIAAAVGTVVILLSAYIPARRAVKKSAIEIIRQTDDIKVSAKSVKTSGLTAALFGLPGTLALKNFKRNKKRYRSTVLSLFVSVVLFISASAFGMYLKQGTDMSVQDYGYDISFSAAQGTYHRSDEELLRLYNEMKGVAGVDGGAYETSLNCTGYIAKDKLTERYIEYMGYAEEESDEVPVYLQVTLLDDEAYARYIAALGLSPEEYNAETGKLAAVAMIRGYDPSTQRSVMVDVFRQNTVSMRLIPGSNSLLQEDAQRDFDFTIVEKMPQEFRETYFMGIAVYAPYSAKALFNAPEELFGGIYMAFTSSDPTASAAAMETVIKSAGITAGYTLFNVDAQQQISRSLILVVNVFTYGFAILISLIAIANVFNTVSTSIHLRRREFAMLRSIGMGTRDFNKMMNFECLFYGLKALLYGLPAAALVTFGIYKAVLNAVDVSFTLPWSSVAISVIAVFFVVFATMLYSVRKVKSANVIDALRDDMA